MYVWEYFKIDILNVGSMSYVRRCTYIPPGVASFHSVGDSLFPTKPAKAKIICVQSFGSIFSGTNVAVPLRCCAQLE